MNSLVAKVVGGGGGKGGDCRGKDGEGARVLYNIFQLSPLTILLSGGPEVPFFSRHFSFSDGTLANSQSGSSIVHLGCHGDHYNQSGSY
jgi:hypothetical protein